MDTKPDLSVFHNGGKSCDYCNGGDIAKCIAFQRISTGLKYYSLFDIENNKNDEEIFTHFINDVYPLREMHNDYTHIIRKHQHQIQDIKQLLIAQGVFEECNLSNCAFTTRHHAREEKEESEDTLDPSLNLAKQRFDSLHFYFFHLFECGLRSTRKDHDDEMKDGDEAAIDRYKCVDDDFSQLITRMNATQAKTEGFRRLKNNNKFNLKANAHASNQDRELLFVDHMMKNAMLATSYDDLKDILLVFKYVVDEEQYDTDAIQFDTSKANGNICGRIPNETCVSSIKDTVDTAQLHSSSFSIGFRFYYWPFYKDKKQVPVKEQYGGNVDDHGGYDMSELFVEQKYSSFKEEIAQYAHLNMMQYHKKVVVKANSYKDTDIVKQTKQGKFLTCKLHYDIAVGSILEYEHLVSVILYTDFNELSADFSASFRKASAFEPISLVKKRNRKYWWLSKMLREAVECFGCCRYERDTNPGLSGPFYCGMSCVMVIPEFNIRLYSPTSTSRQIEIALKFSGANGMVLQLNNMSSGENDRLRAFDCSWISRYPGEDERLFFGGFYRIKLDTVRIRKTTQNFHESVAAMYYLDAILTGSYGIDKLPKNKTNKIYLSALLNRSKKDARIDPYIYDTFEGYIKHKKQIILDLHRLSNDKVDKDILDLILYPLGKGKGERDDEDTTNLLREETVQIFKYTEKIFISSGWLRSQYPLSMSGLLCLVKQTSWEQITVKAVKRRWNKDSWISSLWRNKEKELKKQWKQQNYNIKYKQNEGKYEREEHWLMIDKI
eukprot:703451_1